MVDLARWLAKAPISATSVPVADAVLVRIGVTRGFHAAPAVPKSVPPVLGMMR